MSKQTALHAHVAFIVPGMPFRYLGRLELDPTMECYVVSTIALAMVEQSTNNVFDRALRYFSLYSRARERFLENQETLIKQGVTDDELLIVTTIGDTTLLNSIVSVQQATEFDQLGLEIRRGR